MNKSRQESQLSHHQSDREEWSQEILHAVAGSSTTDEALMACAAAWLLLTQHTYVSVIVFTSSSRCRIAVGKISNNEQLNISVGSAGECASQLFVDKQLVRLSEPQAEDLPLDVVYRQTDQPLAIVADRIPSSQLLSSNVDKDRQTASNLVKSIVSNCSIAESIVPDPEHLESIAEFSAGAGHEINNPLGSIIGQTQLLLRRNISADQKEALETIGAQAWRIRDMIGDAMLFSRPPAPDITSHDLSQVTEETVLQLQETHGLSRSQLSVELPGEITLADVDATGIRNLISHLVANAVQATKDIGTESRIRVSLNTKHDEVIRLSVSDNGCGIQNQQIRRHLFDPFYSGRQAGRGLGFGLCLCWQIVRQHDGSIYCEDLPSASGTEFIIFLPRKQ